MAGFDEMLALEEQQQKLDQDLVAARGVARASSSKAFQTRQRLQQAQSHIEICKKTLDFMVGEAKIVSLKEFGKARQALYDNHQIIVELMHELNILTKKNKEAAAEIPVLEARLKETRRVLSGYGTVLEFKS